MKAEIKLEELLTVVGPSMIVRIIDETMVPASELAQTDYDNITKAKGPAARVRRELSGQSLTVKLIDPTVETENGRYCLRIWIYGD